MAAYFTYQAKSASFTAAAAFAYGVDSSGGAVVCTLPTAVGCAGDEIVVNHEIAGNNLTFNTTSSQLISGQSSGSIVSATGNNCFRFLSDGANWILSS